MVHPRRCWRAGLNQDRKPPHEPGESGGDVERERGDGRDAEDEPDTARDRAARRSDELVRPLAEELLRGHRGVPRGLGAHDVDPERVRRPAVEASEPPCPVLADPLGELGDVRDQHQGEQRQHEDAGEVDEPDRGSPLPAPLVVEVVDARDERDGEEQGDDEHRRQLTGLIDRPEAGRRHEDDPDPAPQRTGGDDDLRHVLLGVRHVDRLSRRRLLPHRSRHVRTSCRPSAHPLSGLRSPARSYTRTGSFAQS